MSLREKFRRLQRLTWGERGLLLEALVWLSFMRVAILVIPFRRLTWFLNMVPEEKAYLAPYPEPEPAAVRRIGWALRAAATHTPWHNTCLVQALAGMVMLRRRKYPGMLTLGVGRNRTLPEGFAAHAWLYCGEIILTGEAGHQDYVVLTSFTSK